MRHDTATATLERPTAPLPRHHLPRSAAVDPEHSAAVCAALTQAFLPAHIDPADALRLAQIAVRHHFSAQSPVLRPDSPNTALWLVGRGRVSVGMPDAQGHWRQARAANGGEWLDVASAWLGGSFFEEAVAATEAIVYELPLDEVQALCDERPSLARLLIQALALRTADRIVSAWEDL